MLQPLPVLRQLVHLLLQGGDGSLLLFDLPLKAVFDIGLLCLVLFGNILVFPREAAHLLLLCANLAL